MIYITEKTRLSDNSVQIILSKEKANDNQEELYFADDDEYRIFCNICEKIVMDRNYNNHLKSSTHIFVKENNFLKQIQVIHHNSKLYFTVKGITIMLYVMKHSKMKVKENIFKI